MPRIRRFDHVGITVADLDTVTAFFVGLGSRGRGHGVRGGRVRGHRLRHPGLPHRDRHAAAARRRVPGWSCRASSGPTTCPGSPDRDGQRAGAAQRVLRGRRPPGGRRPAGRGRVRAGRRHRRVREQRGGWPTSAGPRGSSCPWPSGSADSIRAALDRAAGYLRDDPEGVEAVLDATDDLTHEPRQEP